MLPRPPLSVSLAGLSADPGFPWSSGAREAIEWAASAGFRAVQLDAAARGIRARELDRTGRRDLGALLRRRSLTLSGLDLWIPPEHFLDPARADRALAAALEAVDLAADIANLSGGGAPVLCVSLPPGLSAPPADALRERAESSAVTIADFSWPRSERPEPAFSAGIDPAQHLLAGRDPVQVASSIPVAIGAARLSDATSVSRVVPGARGARLDEQAYCAALSARGYSGPLVLDLRGLPEQDRAARQVLARWSQE